MNDKKKFQEWTPNFSKYIPDGSAVLFVSYNDHERYYKTLEKDFNRRIVYWGEKEVSNINEVLKLHKHAKITIVADSIDSQNIQEINNVAKELKEKYGVEWVGLCARDCFIENSSIFLYNYDDMLRDIGSVESNLLTCYSIYNQEGKKIEEKAFHTTQKLRRSTFIDKLITTNSTGILEVQDTERLKVVDWKEMV
jgi:hypothetical protein